MLVRVRNLPLVLVPLPLDAFLRGDVTLLVSAGFFSALRFDVLEIEMLLSEDLGGGGLFKILATTSNLWLWAGVALNLDLDVDAVDGLGTGVVVVVLVFVEIWGPNLGLAANLLLNITVLAVGFRVASVVFGASV